MGNYWTAEEKRRLKDLGISYSRNSPDKLKAIVEHIKSEKSPYSISRKPLYTGELIIGLDYKTASKYKAIIQKGDLDWVLERDDYKLSLAEYKELEEYINEGGSHQLAFKNLLNKRFPLAITDDHYVPAREAWP